MQGTRPWALARMRFPANAVVCLSQTELSTKTGGFPHYRLKMDANVVHSSGVCNELRPQSARNLGAIIRAS